MQDFQQRRQIRSFQVAVLAIVAALLGATAGRCEAVPGDPVEALRQALRVAALDPAQLAQRRQELTQRANALHGDGELRRSLLLHEWLDEDQDPQIAEVDRTVRNSIVKRLQDSLRTKLRSGGTIAQVAAATMIGEMGISIRGIGTAESSDKGGLARVLAPDLAPLITEGAPRVREAAASAISKINPEPQVAAPALGKALESGDSALRRIAARGLARLITEVTQIIPARGKSVTGVRAESSDVVQMGAAVVPEAAKGLRDTDGEVRRASVEAILAAATALGDLLPAGQEAQVLADENANVSPLARALAGKAPELAATLDDPDVNVRLAACRGLENIANARLRIARRAPANTLPPPVRGTGDRSRSAVDRSGSVAQASAQEIEQVEQRSHGDDRLLQALRSSLPAVSRRLQDPDERVRLAALDFLEVLGEEASGAAPAVIQALTDKNLFVRWASARTLGKMGPVDLEESVPALARLLSDKDLDVRATAASVIEHYGPAAREAVPALARASGIGDVEVRVSALRALQVMGPAAEPAVPAITQALTHPDVRVRLAAAETLGRLGPTARGALDGLSRALNDEDADVRRAASDAILNILSGSPGKEPEQLEVPPKPVEKDSDK
jgi:HEAT repeat protein